MRSPDIFNWGGYLTTGAKWNLSDLLWALTGHFLAFDVPGDAAFSQRFEFFDSDADVNNCIRTITTAVPVGVLGVTRQELELTFG